MKQASKKKSAAKAATGTVSAGVVTKQPESKQAAAAARSIFLYTDDAWSLRYFNQNDLHCKEREVFG